MKSIENFGGNAENNPEDAAEDELESLMEDPQNAFLVEHEANRIRIKDAPTYVEALEVARGLISKRESSVFKFHSLNETSDYKEKDLSAEGIKTVLDKIKKNQSLIGEGGDAYVVIDKSEIEGMPPEVCYKFAIAETTKRGRNPMKFEAVLQSDCRKIVLELEGKIGVPEPFSVTEHGRDTVFAMERLPALSIDDIMRGRGTIPEWFDVDVFCDELKAAIDFMHEKGFYHRDMHRGNVMMRQEREAPEDDKWGYIIDFGLSGYGLENLDPYEKTVAGERFTYGRDDGIVETVRQQLKSRERVQKQN